MAGHPHQTLRYVALLRGINVGRNKRVAMADLRAPLTALGLTDVRTHLQSGNAVFTAPESEVDGLAPRIEKAMADELGLDVRCLVRSGPQLAAVVSADPLPGVATDGSRYLALFLSATPDPDLLARHDPVRLDPSGVRIGDGVIYQWCPDGVLQAPPVSQYIEKHLMVAVTGRNWNTVTKLAALTETLAETLTET